MVRPRNPHPTKKVEPRLSPKTFAYLEDLVDTGAYGNNVTDVAKGLIEEGIRRAIADRIVKVRNPPVREND